jgi:DNA-binding NarL/FixJ family response regulator
MAGQIDLILLDLSVPGTVSGLLYLRNTQRCRCVVSPATMPPSGQCLDCGASGFMQIITRGAHSRAIRRIIDGEVWLPPDVDLSCVPAGESAELVSRLSTLTPQQVRVLMMLGEGLLNKQIAFKLGVSEATIKAHVSAILQKLGVDSRTQAVIAINRIGTTGDWPRALN